MRVSKFWTNIAFVILAYGIAISQEQRQPIFNHTLTLEPSHRIGHTSNTSQIPETLRVLAAMIAFAPDNDSRTTGTGQFELAPSTKKLIDPPPHNRSYFGRHLTFVQNYFKKVSNGKLIVVGTVLDSVYRLPQTIQTYSPLRTSTTNIELGKLMNDAWHLIDSLTPGLAVDQYQAFVIFHAGSGRDIDLTSLYGYDPTPFDIPSLYLNLTSLRKMFGTSYQGVPVRNDSFYITNSLVLPETESRELQAVGGTVTLQLGINGLFAASIGSHLGLPDLFNTKTGRSGIGRFGLMDGQSIFSWNGVFPPEPSAWEKYFLGWINPITVSTGEAVYNIPAVGLASNPDSIYRVPISAKEYFLVENRSRDANSDLNGNRDGSTVTIVRNDSVIQRTWMRDTTHFNAFAQDSLYGDVIDVDEFDWSLPGGVNSKTNEFFDGGILIWHIDETVIEANYATNTVNANPDRRGVDLEEADGSQDIGQAYGFLSPGSGSEDGTHLDFWYANNRSPLRLRANEFSQFTLPDNMSNAGANSHVTVKEFSARAPRMTAKIQMGDEEVRFLSGFPKEIGRRVRVNSVTPFQNNVTSGILISTQSRDASYGDSYFGNYDPLVSFVFGWKLDGTPLLPSGDTLGVLSHSNPSLLVTQYQGKIAIADINGDNVPDLTVSENDEKAETTLVRIKIWSLKDDDNDKLIDVLRELNFPSHIVSSPTVSDSFVVYGMRHGTLLFIRRSSVMDSLSLGFPDTSIVRGVTLFENPDRFIVVSSSETLRVVTPTSNVQSLFVPSGIRGAAIAGMISSSLGKCISFASPNGYVYLLNSNLNTMPGFPMILGDEIRNSPALADIDGDGQRDIIVFSGNRIFAINATGAVLDNFPIIVHTDKTILTSPIVADLDGNGTPDIVAVTQEGLVVAYDMTGKMVRGFPILAGANGGSTPAAFYLPSTCLSCVDIGLAVASDDGHVYAWRTGQLVVGLQQPPEMPWPQYMHDAQNTGLVESNLTPAPKTQTFFPTSMAYNWPNPVGVAENYRTRIRYYVGEDASVKIKIFDMAGDLVQEFSAAGRGGFDNEVEWDVSGIESGVYYAHIEAQGTTQRGAAVIKIAVIK